MTAPRENGFYPDLLGDDWALLPPVVRRLHQEGRARGTVRIERAEGGLAGLLARLFRLPPSGREVPTELSVARRGEGQEWSRRFGEHALRSLQRRLADGRMAERLGLFECRFRLQARPSGLDYAPSGAALAMGPLRLPLPRALAPAVAATTTVQEEGMGVDVTVAAPFCGRVLRYHGTITPANEPAP